MNQNHPANPVMLSYHNDPAIKAKYQSRFEIHRAADEVIQGTGFDHERNRGCFVGCTLDKYDHSRFPIELGWPEWLAHLADKIFEGIPKEEAPQFGTDLLGAVPVGVNLEPVKHRLTIARMDRLILQMATDLHKPKELEPVIQQVIASLQMVRRCAEAEFGKTSCDWSAAESAAWSAESAQSAAWSAAQSAAWSAAFQAERDMLLEILRGLQK